MLDFDFSQIEGFGYLMQVAPIELSTEINRAFATAGKFLNQAIRANATAGLKTRTKGTEKAFKYKTADKQNTKTDLSKNFIDLYSKWAATKIFETGGSIKPAIAGGLTILTDAAKGASGRRRWTSQQMVQMVDSGQLHIVKTPKNWLIVQSKGGTTKTGKPRKGTRDLIIAIIVRQVKEPKRIDFSGTVDSNLSFVYDAVETAIENVTLKLELKKAGEANASNANS